jgi:homoprotocatechuate degradation regulator HpaR
MNASRLPPFEQSLAATLLKAKEAIMAPLRPTLRDANVTEPQWRVMRVLNDRGRTDATGLAEAGLLHAPSVTRILRELEERGLVAREADPGDKRRVMVSLSPAGREMVKVTSRHMARIMADYAERFGEQRLEQLVDELHALSAAVKGIQ